MLILAVQKSDASIDKLISYKQHVSFSGRLMVDAWPATPLFSMSTHRGHMKAAHTCGKNVLKLH